MVGGGSGSSGKATGGGVIGGGIGIGLGKATGSGGIGGKATGGGTTRSGTGTELSPVDGGLLIGTNAGMLTAVGFAGASGTTGSTIRGGGSLRDGTTLSGTVPSALLTTGPVNCDLSTVSNVRGKIASAAAPIAASADRRSHGPRPARCTPFQFPLLSRSISFVKSSVSTQLS